jgi:serine/threonine protein kinase
MTDPSSIVDTKNPDLIKDPETASVGMPTSSPHENLPVDPVEKTVISKSLIDAADAFVRPPTVAELAQVLIGQELDHYILDAIIGGGGMGAVFRGHDKLLDRTVAVKVIPATRRDPDTLRRFRIEAQSAAKLDNPNIARVYNFGESENWNYIVFEFVEGTNLRDLVSTQGPLSVDDAVYYIRQVAEALDHASSRNIVHRDIKPSNVLVTPSGIIKVVDMGLARMTALESSHDITASGVTLGTFDYVSPEQAKDPRDADVRSDLYSLGCTFYFILTGRPPFPDGTAVQKLFKHTSEMPDDPRHFRDDLSPELVAILFKLIAKKPADRYQSAQELIGDLQLLAEIEQLPRSRTWIGNAPLVTRFSRKTTLEMALPWLAAFACLIVVATILFLIQDWSDDYSLPPIIGLNSKDLVAVSEPNTAESETSNNADQSMNAESKNENNEALTSPDNAKNPTNLVDSQSDPEIDAISTGDIPSRSDRDSRPQPAVTVSSNESSNRTIDKTTVFVIPDVNDQKAYDAKWVYTTLQDAIDASNANPVIEEIQLCSNRIDTDSIRLDKRGIKVSAGLGFHPQIVWRPNAEVTSDPCWLDIQQNEVEFRGIHFVWTAESTANSTQPGSSFFRSHTSGRLRLSDCTITIESASSTPIVSVIQVANMRDGTDPESADLSEPFQLRMENTIVRGQCDFIRMPETVRSEINWKNGFLCVSGSMLDLHGTAVRHRSLPTTRITLDRVTVVCGQHFAQLRLSEERPFKISLIRTATNSAFWCSKDHALISAQGVVDAPEVQKMIDLRGNENAYDRGIRCAIETVTPAGEITSLDFNDLSMSSLPESGIETNIRWVQPIAKEFQFAEQLPSQFRQRVGEFMPGFVEDKLPTVPSGNY